MLDGIYGAILIFFEDPQRPTAKREKKASFNTNPTKNFTWWTLIRACFGHYGDRNVCPQGAYVCMREPGPTRVKESRESRAKPRPRPRKWWPQMPRRQQRFWERDRGRLHRKDFNRKDSKGQSRKKEGFAQIPCDRKGSKPTTSFSMGSSKIQPSGKLKPNSVPPEDERP